MTFFTINASSQPVYNTFGFSDYWECADWIKWYNELRKVYNADESDYLWSKAWIDGVDGLSGGNGTAPGSSYINNSVPTNCGIFDSDFKSLLETRPNLKSVVYTGLSGLIARPIGLGVDVVNGIVTIGSNTFSGILTTSKILKYAIPIAFVILFILLVIFSIKYSNKKLQNA